MDEGKRRLVHGWLAKAAHDLESARRLSDGPDPLLDTAIYHCQQAAEKVLKGFLAFHDQEVVKTHDLRFLAGQAQAFEPRFGEWLEVAEGLTPYAVAYRYPDEDLEPEAEEFEMVRQDSIRLVGFVLELLPQEVRPELELQGRHADGPSPAATPNATGADSGDED